MSTKRSRVVTYAIIAVMALGASLNCAGGGCEGCEVMGPIPGGFPLESRIENGVQVRLTPEGLQFVEDNVDVILADMLPDGLVFPVPPVCDQTLLVGTLDLCGTGDANNCVPDDPACQIEMEILGLNVVPKEPSSVDVEARINIWSLDTMHTHSTLSALECDIDVDTRLGSQNYATAVATIDFVQDSGSNRTRAVLGSVDFPDGEIESQDLVISGGVSCWAIDTFLKGTIINEIEKQVQDQVEPMMRNTCVVCDPVSPSCPQASSCQEVVEDEVTYNWCMEDSGEGCVQLMGVEGRLQLGALLASVSPGNETTLDIHTWAGGYASAVNEGLSLGALSGVLGNPPHHPCVPQVDPPSLTPAPRSTVFEENTRPDGNPYQLGFGVHKSVLDAAGYALYDTGTMCLDVGPRQSDFLNTGTFVVLLDSLNDLVHDGEPAMVLSIRPTKAVTFDLGSGTSDATGNIEEPLITMRSQDMHIDFYALIDYRYIRLFRMKGDLALPLNLTVNESRQIVPVLGELENAFENIEVVDSPLLTEDPEEIAAVFPMLMDTASGMLGEDFLAPIDLPDFRGFRIVLEEGSITSVDNDTFLAFFADLAYVGPQPPDPSPLVGAVNTSARLESLWLPPDEEYKATTVEHTLHNGPVAVVALDADLEAAASNAMAGAEGATLEFSYRLDGGFWSPFRRGSKLEIRRPSLWLQGRHVVEVKARLSGHPESADPTPAAVEVLVDTVPPALSRRVTKAGLLVDAKDRVSPEGALRYRVKAREGGWSSWESGPLRVDPRQVEEVEVRDEAGNASSMGVARVALYGRVEPPPATGCGCVQAAGQGEGRGAGLPLGIWLLMGLLFGGGWITRRRLSAGGRRRSRSPGRSRVFFAGLVLAGLVVGLLAVGCGGNSSGTKECGDATNLPLICADPVPDCEPYEDLVGLEEMTLDPQTCDPVPVPCECHADEIEPGDYGRFLSMAESDGQLLVACYSDRWGDLNVVEVGSDGELTPEAVDGVPFGTPPAGDTDGFREGLARKGDDMGKFPSLALDKSGNAHISYLDLEVWALKYANGTPGDWSTSYVQDPEDRTEHQKTVYSKLLLDSADVPHVLFMVTGLEADVEGDTFKSELRLAVGASAAPAGPEDWTVSVVDETPIPCAGFCGNTEICLADNWTCVAAESGCGECGPKAGCHGGVCVPILPEVTWTDHPEGIGLYVSAGWLSDGRLVAAYHDRSAGLVRVAAGVPGGTVELQTLEGDASTDVGLYTSLAVGADDTVHITYHDALEDALIYRQLDDELTPQVREVVDAGQRADGHHVVGLDSKVFLGADGAVHVLYQDGTTADLWEGVRSSGTEWVTQPYLEGDPGYGFFVDVVEASDGAHWVGEYRYDRVAEMFGALYVYPLR